MLAGQSAGTHCTLSEFCVGTTTQLGRCDFGLLAIGLGQKVAANLPFGADHGQPGRYRFVRRISIHKRACDHKTDIGLPEAIPLVGITSAVIPTTFRRAFVERSESVLAGCTRRPYSTVAISFVCIVQILHCVHASIGLHQQVFGVTAIGRIESLADA